MTPQEYADKLVNDFHRTCNATIAGASTLFRQIAVNAAILCVEEVLEALNHRSLEFAGRRIVFYQQVLTILKEKV